MRGMKAPSNGLMRALVSRRRLLSQPWQKDPFEGCFANALSPHRHRNDGGCVGFPREKNFSPVGEELVAIEARALARCAARDRTSPAEANAPQLEKSERSKRLAWKEARPTRHCEERNRTHGDGVHLGKAALRRSPYPAARRLFRKRRLLPAQRRLRPRSWSARAQGRR